MHSKGRPYVRWLWSRNWHKNEEGKEERGEGKGEECGCDDDGDRGDDGNGSQQHCLTFNWPAFRYVNVCKKN